VYRCLGTSNLRRRVYANRDMDASESTVHRRDQSVTALDCFHMECQLNRQGGQEVWLVLPIEYSPVLDPHFCLCLCM
jgi:hypothetical protein